MNLGNRWKPHFCLKNTKYLELFGASTRPSFFFGSFFPVFPLDLGRQFGGGPLSGHWSWLDQGGQTSDQWSAGEGWNMKYDFCFRDEARKGTAS